MNVENYLCEKEYLTRILLQRWMRLSVRASGRTALVEGERMVISRERSRRSMEGVRTVF